MMIITTLLRAFMSLFVESKSKPILFNSTDWSKLGYPILDKKVDYPYTPEPFKGTNLILYESGPAGINEGDVLMLQQNGAQYKIDNEWFSCGAVGPDGKYLKISKEFADWTGLNGEQYPNCNSFQEVEDIIAEAEKEEGQVLASEEDIISYYLSLLKSTQKTLNEDKTQVLPIDTIVS